MTAAPSLTYGPPIRFSELCGFHEKQWEATRTADSHKYTLYGGRRGPGKSYWLRWYPVRFLLKLAAEHHLTNVRVGLFCENYPALKDRHITKLANEFPDWLGELKNSLEEGLAFHIGERYGGGVIALRNLDDPDKYKSSEFALVAVDELTQNKSVSMFNTLRGSMRWPGLPESKFIAGSNPDGPGQKWVRQYWVERNFPEELQEQAGRFAYVPAGPTDNPHLSEDYWEELRSLPTDLRKAWLDGDWYVTFEGLVYTEFGSENITQEDPDPELPIELAFDDGYIDPRAILFIQRTGTRVLVFDELYHSKHLEEECVREVVDKCREWFGEDEDGRPLKLPELAVGSPEANALHKHFHKANITVRTKAIPTVVEALKPVRALIKDGQGVRTLQVHPRCRNLIDELTSGYRYPPGSGRSSAEKPLDENNHACDALRDWTWSRANGGSGRDLVAWV